MYVGVSSSVLIFLEATQVNFVYLLFHFSRFSPLLYDRFLKFRQILSAVAFDPCFSCLFGLSGAYREFVNSPFASLTDPYGSFTIFFRLPPLRGKESSLFVPSFLLFFAVSLRHFADPYRLAFICASVCPLQLLYERLKHFLFASFFFVPLL